ncbi:hypothetical protein J6TS7_31880 [Paenibacillus dendritiformis]|nr:MULTISPECIES: hypothetical protein [Paenibacillus]MEB9896789.1 hypothetical protein [Bacillus cereus]GIO79578.1 hypothetical protein J6TS7_31880 [Paenibacillus dendritiformis]
MKDTDVQSKKIIVDTGVFDRELLEKVCREIKQKKEQQSGKSA